MDLGLAIFLTDRSIRPDVLARSAEEAGFSSLWLPEHTHLPLDHASAPGGRDLPDEYRRTLDPFVALSAAATVTERLEVATGICLVGERDPITTAKEVATLDHLSGGRVTFGIGYGWIAPEMEHHGVAFPSRREVVRERVLAMKALWTEEEASFDGDHVRFAPSWSWPKPAQDPHPPIVLGADIGPRTLDHLVEFCDGWLPMGRRMTEAGIGRVRRAVAEAGRDPDSFTITVFGTRPEPGQLEELAALGVDRVVLWLPPDAAEGPVLDALERHTGLLEAI